MSKESNNLIFFEINLFISLEPLLPPRISKVFLLVFKLKKFLFFLLYDVLFNIFLRIGFPAKTILLESKKV